MLHIKKNIVSFEESKIKAFLAMESIADSIKKYEAKPNANQNWITERKQHLESIYLCIKQSDIIVARNRQLMHQLYQCRLNADTFYKGMMQAYEEAEVLTNLLLNKLPNANNEDLKRVMSKDVEFWSKVSKLLS